MKTTLQVISMVLAAAFLALVAVAGWAWMSGLVTMEKLEAARKAMLAASASTAPAAEARPLALQYVEEKRKEEQRAVEDLKAQEEALAMRLNEERAKLARIEGEAARKSRELADREAGVARAEKAFAAEKAAHDKVVKGAAFRRQVEMFESMKERDAARRLYGYENALALDLLRAFDSAFRAKVLDEVDRLDRSPENAAREPKGPALLRGLWPGETASAGR